MRRDERRSAEVSREIDIWRMATIVARGYVETRERRRGAEVQDSPKSASSGHPVRLLVSGRSPRKISGPADCKSWNLLRYWMDPPRYHLPPRSLLYLGPPLLLPRMDVFTGSPGLYHPPIERHDGPPLWIDRHDPLDPFELRYLRRLAKYGVLSWPLGGRQLPRPIARLRAKGYTSRARPRPTAWPPPL
jgi:hypothetical protein